MIDDIIKQEEDLQATLRTTIELVEEYQYNILKGMIPQYQKLISRSLLAVLNLCKWNKNNNLGEENGETNESTT